MKTKELIISLQTPDMIEGELEENIKNLHKRMVLCRTTEEVVDISNLISKLIQEATDKILNLRN